MFDNGVRRPSAHARTARRWPPCRRGRWGRDGERLGEDGDRELRRLQRYLRLFQIYSKIVEKISKKVFTSNWWINYDFLLSKSFWYWKAFKNLFKMFCHEITYWRPSLFAGLTLLENPVNTKTADNKGALLWQKKLFIWAFIYTNLFEKPRIIKGNPRITNFRIKKWIRK